MYEILSNVLKEAATIKRKTSQFYYDAMARTLYRHSQNGILVRCLSDQEAWQVIMEAHDGTCGAYQLGLKLGDRICRMGYY